MTSTLRLVPGDPAMTVGYTLGPADGGRVSTALGMTKWDRAPSAGTTVSARSLEEVYRRTTLNDGRIQDYGIAPLSQFGDG